MEQGEEKKEVGLASSNHCVVIRGSKLFALPSCACAAVFSGFLRSSTSALARTARTRSEGFRYRAEASVGSIYIWRRLPR